MMKQYIIAALIGIVTISSCTKLDVPVNSQLTSDNFPKTDEQFIAASLPAYTQLRAQYALAYWFLQELSTDEAIIPARGGNWYDNSKYKDLHLHVYTPDHEFVETSWSWGYNGISTCNRILKLFAPLPDNSAKTTTVAELRATRALFYYFMMDLYGNVPIVTTFGDTTLPATSPRTAVFDFIESELKDVLPALSTATGAATYGRPTKWMAFALLAKMYINAQYYVNKDMNAETVAVCDSIISSGQFALDADYLSMFNINNGPQIKDFIFAIPYDNVQAQGQYFARYNLHFYLYPKYSMPYVPSNAESTLPEFYALFNDPNDVRNNEWLAGPQYDYKGNPIAVQTTKIGVDAGYTGSDPDAPVTYQLNFTPNVVIKDLNSFDVGNDMKGQAEGIRNNKFYPDSTSTTRNQSNDVPVFRYADVLMMKAEAILRGAAPTMGATALSLVNQVRSRAKAAPFTNIDLQTLLDERGREFAYEAWRRNDLIRFGQFENGWGYKTDTRVSRRIFPIPTPERTVNPKLVQNTDY
jgi:starch-binding outer membrane protein, SusD/RagB family